jgi:hypothetical protein
MPPLTLTDKIIAILFAMLAAPVIAVLAGLVFGGVGV